MRAVLFQIAIAVLVCVAGLSVYAFTVNLLIAGNVAAGAPAGFGHDMTQRAVLVWMACALAAFLSIPLLTRWKYALLLSPAYGPSLFAAVYALAET